MALTPAGPLPSAMSRASDWTRLRRPLPGVPVRMTWRSSDKASKEARSRSRSSRMSRGGAWPLRAAATQSCEVAARVTNPSAIRAAIAGGVTPRLCSRPAVLTPGWASDESRCSVAM